MYYVTLYHSAPDADPASFARNIEVYPRHRAFVDEFARGGGLWMIGTFANPMVEGSMAIFRTREAAEEFLAGDPFMTEGLVHSVDLREWNPLEYPAYPAP